MHLQLPKFVHLLTQYAECDADHLHFKDYRFLWSSTFLLWIFFGSHSSWEHQHCNIGNSWELVGRTATQRWVGFGAKTDLSYAHLVHNIFFQLNDKLCIFSKQRNGFSLMNLFIAAWLILMPWQLFIMVMSLICMTLLMNFRNSLMLLTIVLIL